MAPTPYSLTLNYENRLRSSPSLPTEEEERAGERSCVFIGFPLSPTLSRPFLAGRGRPTPGVIRGFPLRIPSFKPQGPAPKPLIKDSRVRIYPNSAFCLLPSAFALIQHAPAILSQAAR